MVLIPVALILGLGGLGVFFWSLRAGQYEDLDGAAVRILIDDGDKPRAEPAIVAPDKADPNVA
jgi:cbb3-type cytochrome oxidase maturation protein